MKKILFILFFLPVVSFAWQNDYFKITSEWPYEPGNKILVELNKKTIPSNIKQIQLFVWDQQLKRLANTAYPKYEFEVLDNLDSMNRQLSIKIDYQDGKYQDFVLTDAKIPYFGSIDAIDAKWGGKITLTADLTGSCKLVINDKTSWSIGNYNWILSVTVPKQILEPVNGGYIECNKLNSNYKKFYVPASPKLYYVIEKNKKQVLPWSTLVLKWANIRLHPSDDIQLLLNWKPIDFKFVDDNTLQFTLPDIIIKNWTLKVVRNSFESNTLKFSALKYPLITNVSTNYWNDGAYFEIYGKFDFSLWEPAVKFNGKNLQVLSYRKISPDLSMIKAVFPVSTPYKDDFRCSTKLLPWNLIVTIWGVDSNAYFYSFDNKVELQKVDNLSCNNGYCRFNIFVSGKLPSKFHVLINNSITDYSANGNIITVTTNNLKPYGTIQLELSDCTYSNMIYYDFIDFFKPKILKIYSDDKFKPYTEFYINGDKLTQDGLHDKDKMNVKVSLDPDVLESWSLYLGYTDIKGRLSFVDDWQLVKVSLSNINWKSNGWYFVVGEDKSFMWNPIIENVLFENWQSAGKQAKIIGYNFSQKCTENEVYVWNKVVYPTECDYNYLVFNLPSKYITSLKIKVKQGESDIYKVNFGGYPSVSKFNIVPQDGLQTIDVNNIKSWKVKFLIANPMEDIFVPEMKFYIKSQNKLPIWDITLKVNWNYYQYYFDQDTNKVYKLRDKLVGQIDKSKSGYIVTFKNVYIPYSDKSLVAELDFLVYPIADNQQVVQIFSPNIVSYYNIYNSKLSNVKLDSKLIGNLKFINLQSICFDSDPTYKNCALVLRWQQPKFTQQKTSTDQQSTKSQQSIVSKPTKDVSQTQKPLTREEKIAQRLTLQKMELLNNVLYSFIKQMKNKYRNNKTKLKYIVEMYRWYKQMIANTSDNMQAKVNYVKWLIYFAKNYFAFVKAN